LESQKPQQKRLYEFGPFCIDASERVLLRDGQPITLSPKLFDTLLALVEHNGHIVEKNDLMEKLWPDSFVEESNLVSNVSLLRKALGDNAGGTAYIQTIPRRGYRFVAEVNERLADDVDLLVHRRTRARIITHDEDEARALPEFSAALRSLAILPFMTIGVPPEEEYLGLGLTDALITQFGNTSQIVVRPTSAVRPFIGMSQDSVTIGRALRVNGVLEGSVQRAGERVRVTVRLVNVNDELTLWAEKFDTRFTDIFQVQDAIADQVARALMLKLSGEEHARLVKHYTENVEAYRLYLMGRYEWVSFSPQGITNSIDYYNRAIAIDPEYALAYAGLADSYMQQAHNGSVTPVDGYQEAKRAAEKAIELDNSLAEAHCSRAVIAYFFDWDWDATESAIQRVLALNPNFADAHQMYSNLWMTRGRPDEALAEIAVALELNPLSPLHHATKVQELYFSGRYDEALAEARRALEASPHFFLGHAMLGRIYEQLGMYQEAVAEFQKGVNVFGREPQMLAGLGRAYAMAGERDAAMAVLSEMEEIARHRYVPAYWIAMVHAGLGDHDQALSWLERAYDERYFYLVWLNVTPHFKSLHSNPRFAELMRRVGLETYPPQ
jgi:DNA-binding winged helix-turn-helix (wHTH) protein/tetratricopeptide (TPR) repeat protein